MDYYNEIKEYTEKVFEDIKHIDEFGNEYWLARELQKVLGYHQWRSISDLIERAKVACNESNVSIENHFAVQRKMIKLAKGAKRNVVDYKLSRYACYLIAQNGDSRKKTIALAQTYFAIQTRKQELTEIEFSKLSEDEKRLYTRKIVRNKNLFLFETAKKSGVKNYGKFNNYGYRGLYNGEDAKDIAKRKGIDENEEILDYMGSTELAANLFRITQTDEVLKNKKVNNENVACVTHHNVGQSVRQTIKRIGGTMPEDLPTPKKSIKQLQLKECEKIKEVN